MACEECRKKAAKIGLAVGAAALTVVGVILYRRSAS